MAAIMMPSFTRMSFKNVQKGFKRIKKANPILGKAFVAAGFLWTADLVRQASDDEERRGVNLRQTGEAMALGFLVVGPVGGHMVRALEKRAIAFYPPPFKYAQQAWLYKLGVTQMSFFGAWASLNAANAACEGKSPACLEVEQVASEEVLGKQLRHQGFMTGALYVGFKFTPIPAQFSFLLGSHLFLEIVEEWYDTCWANGIQSTQVMMC